METQQEVQELFMIPVYDASPWNFVYSELLYEFSYTLSAL
jgi:hypothetical protein